MEENRMPAQEQTSAAPVATPKKKSSAGKIIALILGSIVVCCFVAGFIVYSIWNGIQNGPQATSLKNVWQGLDTGNEALVKKYSDELVYSDLYTKDAEGVTNADLIKGSNIKVTIANVSVDIDAGTADVYFVLTADKNTEILGSINYAKLEKVGELWIVTYIGTQTVPTDSPSSSSD